MMMDPNSTGRSLAKFTKFVSNNWIRGNSWNTEIEKPRYIVNRGNAVWPD